jgi:hypothetical protein
LTAIDHALGKFDESKAKVRREIRDGFFREDGTMRISDRELRQWIGERAVDELKVVLQLSTILVHAAHLIPSNILVRVSEQIADESRHFDALRKLVPDDLQSAVDEKVAELPAKLASDEHWVTLLAATDAGNPFSALLDINIVHEGYSAAAIEELVKLPYDDVRATYEAISADEERHHEAGRELLLWLTGAAHDTASSEVIASAHQRADGGASMGWSWP